jgi:hypothetical protein
MSEQKEGGVPPAESGNVLSFDMAVAARRRPEPATEPFLTNQERAEIREMLAYFRRERPIYEAAKQGCTILRRLSEEM